MSPGGLSEPGRVCMDGGMTNAAQVSGWIPRIGTQKGWTFGLIIDAEERGRFDSAKLWKAERTKSHVVEWRNSIGWMSG